MSSTFEAVFSANSRFGRALRVMFSSHTKMRNTKPIVSFTFDDFPHSAVSNGARLLEQYGARGTFYLTGAFCGRVVEDIPQYSAEDLAALAGAGHEIGCHTFTHPRVSQLSPAQLQDELERNAAFLRRHLPGNELLTFAYPYGDISPAAAALLRPKFLGCRCSDPGLNIGAADLARLRSIRLYNTMINPDRISKLVSDAVAQTAWIIFYTHDVDLAPSKYGCTPSLLEHALKSAVASGAEILTVQKAVEAVRGDVHPQ